MPQIYGKTLQRYLYACFKILSIRSNIAYPTIIMSGDLNNPCSDERNQTMSMVFRRERHLSLSLLIFPYNKSRHFRDSSLCGKAGIRTLGTRKGTTVFETAPIDHSGTFPVECKIASTALRVQSYKKNLFTKSFADFFHAFIFSCPRLFHLGYFVHVS